LNLIDC